MLIYNIHITCIDIDDDPNGFAIHINDKNSKGKQENPIWYLRAGSLEEKRDWLNRLSKVMAIVKWMDDYEKVKIIGMVCFF